MNKIISLFLIACFCCLSFAAPYSDPNKTKMNITVTTANIGEIVKAVGGDKVDVYIMIKPLMCPSDYDITPQAVEKAEKSNLILSHKWEKWVNKLKLEVGDLGKLYKTIETDGNWMIPYIHIRAAEEIKSLLVSLDEENAKYYEENYTQYAYEVNFAASVVKKELEKAYGVKVMSNFQVKDFLENYGFDVVAVYGKSGELSAKRLSYLIKEGKKDKIKLVIDSLQMGASAGRELAKNTGAKQIAISSFILGKSYVNTLKDNVARLKKALE
ncbi:MAG: metal ABC transporter substrate-binding protein [Endomicrobium sp.]|jgi:ABC-type Zn uptake system ZnuABC Zn-binding protein ZnuA|nr:metal ABC transporter substrate-binding protein [Endomicrobium sp.]